MLQTDNDASMKKNTERLFQTKYNFPNLSIDKMFAKLGGIFNRKVGAQLDAPGPSLKKNLAALLLVKSRGRVYYVPFVLAWRGLKLIDHVFHKAEKMFATYVLHPIAY